MHVGCVHSICLTYGAPFACWRGAVVLSILYVALQRVAAAAVHAVPADHRRTRDRRPTTLATLASCPGQATRVPGGRPGVPVGRRPAVATHQAARRLWSRRFGGRRLPSPRNVRRS